MRLNAVIVSFGIALAPSALPEPGLAWVLEEGSDKYPSCTLVTEPYLTTPVGEPAVIVLLQFDAWPEKTAVAQIELFLTATDQFFQAFEDYSVTIVDAANPGNVHFKDTFSNHEGYEISYIVKEEKGIVPNSVLQTFAKALFGDTPRHLFVESPVNGQPIGPFPIDTAATGKLLPKFSSCVKGL